MGGGGAQMARASAVFVFPLHVMRERLPLSRGVRPGELAAS